MQGDLEILWKVFFFNSKHNKRVADAKMVEATNLTKVSVFYIKD